MLSQDYEADLNLDELKAQTCTHASTFWIHSSVAVITSSFSESLMYSLYLQIAGEEGMIEVQVHSFTINLNPLTPSLVILH